MYTRSVYGLFPRGSLAAASHVFTSLLNTSTSMPLSVAATTVSSSWVDSRAIASRLPDSMVRNDASFARSGFAFTTAGTRSRQNASCV
jgi:hypothetical protein